MWGSETPLPVLSPPSRQFQLPPHSPHSNNPRPVQLTPRGSFHPLLSLQSPVQMSPLYLPPQKMQNANTQQTKARTNTKTKPNRTSDKKRNDTVWH